MLLLSLSLSLPSDFPAISISSLFCYSVGLAEAVVVVSLWIRIQQHAEVA
ncbi:uncharacterized protein G2W53_012324 [Senna tora]|uniref:Uncharacterized protein n=1 Tax=Senna tora TaxID=362788 RepID=A0A834U0T7_9FABA|nr:uncharacterized protein G2W53_012324 [Senna tora]